MRRKILIIIILLIPLFFINLDTIVLGFIYNKEYLLKIPNENMFKRLFIISWSELAKDKSALSNMGKATYLLLPLQLFEEDVKDNQVKESILIIDNQKKGLLCGYYSPFKGNLALAAYLFYFIEGNDIFCQVFLVDPFVNKWNVQDLNEDETPEIIINYVIASSTSHAECIIWPTIYKWDGLKYIETSKDFPEYYKGIVEETNNRLAELSKIDLEEKAKSDKRSKEQLAKWRQLHMADIEVLLFKAKQMIGEKRAGFDRAVSWCLNEDPKLRRNAVTIFAGIMDVKSQEYLRQMTKDQDPIVSQMAIDALKSK